MERLRCNAAEFISSLCLWDVLPTGSALNQHSLPLAPIHKDKACHPVIPITATSTGQIQASRWTSVILPMTCLYSYSLSVNTPHTDPHVFEHRSAHKTVQEG